MQHSHFSHVQELLDANLPVYIMQHLRAIPRLNETYRYNLVFVQKTMWGLVFHWWRIFPKLGLSHFLSPIVTLNNFLPSANQATLEDEERLC